MLVTFRKAERMKFSINKELARTISICCQQQHGCRYRTSQIINMLLLYRLARATAQTLKARWPSGEDWHWNILQ